MSANQIAAMVPYELAGTTTAEVEVQNGDGISPPYTVVIAETSPGIFSADASGKGNVAAANSDGSANGPANPARQGSYVTFYLTGAGQTSPAGIDGEIATGTSHLLSSVKVTVGGVQAQVLYSGAAPGNVDGFIQVNAVVPSGLAAGGELPLLIDIGGIPSQSGLTIAVQ